MAVHDSGDVTFDDEQGLLAWYDSSQWGQRAFCTRCGTSLAFRVRESGETLVSAGTLTSSDGLEISSHIFCDQRPDYYDLTGDAPRMTEAETLAYFEQQGDASAPKP